jgi:hypothetical protein
MNPYPAPPPPAYYSTDPLYPTLPLQAPDSQRLDSEASKKRKTPHLYNGTAPTEASSVAPFFHWGTTQNPVEILSSPETTPKKTKTKPKPKVTKPKETSSKEAKSKEKRLKISTKLTKYEKMDLSYHVTGDSYSYLPPSIYAHSQSATMAKIIREAEEHGVDYAYSKYVDSSPVSSTHGSPSISLSDQPIAQLPDISQVTPDTSQVTPDTKQDTSLCKTEPTLVPEQQKVVDLILEGHNVFYTGSAGCGKSTILRAFVSQLKASGRRVQILAPTNLAALNVDGQTTWNFAGWTPDSMKKSLEKLKSDAFGTKAHARLTEVDVVVIDEISMIENLQFERLNEVMKHARDFKNSGKGAFGGAQIVVTGDVSSASSLQTRYSPV